MPRGCSITRATWGRVIESQVPPAVLQIACRRSTRTFGARTAHTRGAQQIQAAFTAFTHRGRLHTRRVQRSRGIHHGCAARRVPRQRRPRWPRYKLPRRSSKRNSFGTNPRGDGCTPPPSTGASPLEWTASHSLMNGAVVRLSVTGLAHFVMRGAVAAPRSCANLLILKKAYSLTTIIFTMPPDGISIANPKPSKAGHR